MFHYRPYKEIKQEDDNDCTFGAADEQQAAFSQTLLYVNQEQWQQQLLRRYGNTIVLIDATYKTKYELRMFFVTVKTNVGYTPIADFVVQSETSDQIEEASNVIASWNPDWNPPYFMTDYSDAETTAIDSIFSQCKVYLCDFHREQCWERWIKDKKHGLSPTDGKILIGLLRSCAWASPGSGDLPVDCHFQQAVDKLQKTNVWKSNQ